ncbi:unnamed protein product, partial [Laminaria digitata]
GHCLYSQVFGRAILRILPELAVGRTDTASTGSILGFCTACTLLGYHSRNSLATTVICFLLGVTFLPYEARTAVLSSINAIYLPTRRVSEVHRLKAWCELQHEHIPRFSRTNHNIHCRERYIDKNNEKPTETY